MSQPYDPKRIVSDIRDIHQLARRMSHPSFDSYFDSDEWHPMHQERSVTDVTPQNQNELYDGSYFIQSHVYPEKGCRLYMAGKQGRKKEPLSTEGISGSVLKTPLKPMERLFQPSHVSVSDVLWCWYVKNNEDFEQEKDDAFAVFSYLEKKSLFHMIPSLRHDPQQEQHFKRLERQANEARVRIQKREDILELSGFKGEDVQFKFFTRDAMDGRVQALIRELMFDEGVIFRARHTNPLVYEEGVLPKSHASSAVILYSKEGHDRQMVTRFAQALIERQLIPRMVNSSRESVLVDVLFEYPGDERRGIHLHQLVDLRTGEAI